jgi:DNA-binding CsgD family transcriptional regulator
MTALAALELLSEAAALTPVVLVADDAQWLDRPTADVLAFIARRVESDPVLLLAAIRDGYASPLLGAGLPGLQLEGLAAAAAGELLDGTSPGLPPAARSRVLAEAGGNPLALIELPAALTADPGTAAAPGRLPLTRRLEQALAARAAELPRAAQALLLIAAADDGSTLAQVMRAAAIATGAESTVSDLVPSIEARLIEADDRAPRFYSALVRSAVYQAASVADRHTAHAALAAVLTEDPDRRAWHRAAATPGPDPAVAADLEDAARRARAAGAIHTAAAAFERAAQFTPGPARRGALLLSAAEAARELGHTDHAARLLREADACLLSPHERAYAIWLGDASGEEEESVGAPVIVRALAEAARQAAAAKDLPLALNLLSAAAVRCHWSDLGSPAADEVLSVADSMDASPDDPLLLHIQAHAAPLTRGPAVLEYLARAVPSDDPQTLFLLGSAACLAGDYHGSCSLLGGAAARLRGQGRLRVLTHALAVRAWAAIMTADYRTAQPAAEEAARLAAETAQPLWQAVTWSAQAALAAVGGDQAAADSLTARVEQHMLPVGASEPLSLAQYARGLAALGQGQHVDAWAHLQRIYEPGDPACSRRTQYRAIADLAEAAARTGHQDHALAVLERFRPLRDQSPWLGGAVAYADALLADDDHAEASYAHALAHHLAPWPFTRARLRLAFGEWLRRQRRPADSRAHLRAARDAFDALGTMSWSDRAARELRASGENSRHRAPNTVEQLTPQELQIIYLAAEGLSNREIGQRLYLSHRTVESHLYRIYPKLGITSRAQLAKILSEIPAMRVAV